jgi:hypothetical protein
MIFTILAFRRSPLSTRFVMLFLFEDGLGQILDHGHAHFRALLGRLRPYSVTPFVIESGSTTRVDKQQIGRRIFASDNFGELITWGRSNASLQTIGSALPRLRQSARTCEVTKTTPRIAASSPISKEDILPHTSGCPGLDPGLGMTLRRCRERYFVAGACIFFCASSPRLSSSSCIFFVASLRCSSSTLGSVGGPSCALAKSASGSR